MGKYSYVTNRVVKNKEGKETGKVKGFVLAGSNIFQVDYICPECGFSEHKDQDFKRPITIKCSKCNSPIRISKLKDEIKKEKKKAKL